MFTWWEVIVTPGENCLYCGVGLIRQAYSSDINYPSSVTNLTCSDSMNHVLVFEGCGNQSVAYATEILFPHSLEARSPRSRCPR